MTLGLRENIVKTPRHTTWYLDAGPVDGPLIIFTHGWPERSISWRHQLQFFGAMGFHAVAPDMRGYGHSSVYTTQDAYRLEETTKDMIELIDHLGRERAVWVGHDWGSPVTWSMARHHPERCHGVASLCVPYAVLEQGFEYLVSLVDRELYPEEEFPFGQWDYMQHYREDFDEATASMDANPGNMVRLLFRKGTPEGRGQPAATATTRKNGGWFGGLDEPPLMPMDTDVIDEESHSIYTAGLAQNGFFGPNAWYMNHDANAVFFSSASTPETLDMPVLFIHASYDYVCYTIEGKLAEPMRERCNNLIEKTVDSGHWMAQEKPMEVNRHLVQWLSRTLPDLS